MVQSLVFWHPWMVRGLEAVPPLLVWVVTVLGPLLAHKLSIRHKSGVHPIHFRYTGSIHRHTATSWQISPSPLHATLRAILESSFVSYLRAKFVIKHEKNWKRCSHKNKGAGGTRVMRFTLDWKTVARNVKPKIEWSVAQPQGRPSRYGSRRRRPPSPPHGPQRTRTFIYVLPWNTVNQHMTFLRVEGPECV